MDVPQARRFSLVEPRLQRIRPRWPADAFIQSRLSAPWKCAGRLPGHHPGDAFRRTYPGGPVAPATSTMRLRQTAFVSPSTPSWPRGRTAQDRGIPQSPQPTKQVHSDPIFAGSHPLLQLPKAMDTAPRDRANRLQESAAVDSVRTIKQRTASPAPKKRARTISDEILPPAWIGEDRTKKADIEALAFGR